MFLCAAGLELLKLRVLFIGEACLGHADGVLEEERTLLGSERDATDRVLQVSQGRRSKTRNTIWHMVGGVECSQG